MYVFQRRQWHPTPVLWKAAVHGVASFILFRISMKIKILQFPDVMKDLFFHSNKSTACILIDTI